MTSTSRDLDAEAWRTSSHSQQGGGTCVEVAPLADAVGVRDTENRDLGAHVVTRASWTALINAIKTNRL